MSLSNSQVGGRFQRCAAYAADHRRAIAAGQRVLHLPGAVRTIKRFGGPGLEIFRLGHGSAEKIPAPDGYFTKALSVESFYYYADQGQALDELRRVLAPAGKLFILINLYKDNHYSLRWVSELKVPVQALSEQEYLALLQRHGFSNVQARRIPDRSPSPDVYSGKWFKNAGEL